MAGRRSIDNFSAIRLGLAIVVIFSHSFYLTKLSQEAEPFFQFTHRQLDGGTAAVHCFLELSGFLVCGSWFKSGSFREYILRRLRRIYPGFITATLMSAFFFGPLGGVILPDQSIFNWIFRTITLQDPNIVCPSFCWTNPYRGIVNGSLWTIRYEEFMYAILATLGLFKLIKGPVALAIFVMFSFRLIPGGDIFDRLGAHFFAGVLFYLYGHKVAYKPSLICLSAAIILITCITGSWLNFILPIPGTYLLLALALNSKLQLRRLVFFTKDADLSYGMYLYAFPVQQLFVHYGVSDPNLLSLVSLLVSFIFAFASWNLIESPFLMQRKAPPISIDGAAPAISNST